MMILHATALYPRAKYATTAVNSLSTGKREQVCFEAEHVRQIVEL